MDRAGDELLARAALAGDEHRGRGPRHLVDDLDDLPHGGRLPHEGVHVLAPRELGPEHHHLALERALLEGAPDQQEHLLRVEGLGEVVEGSELHGDHGGLDRLHRRHQDHVEPVIERPDPLEHLESVDSRQSDVQEDEIDRAGPEHLERLRAVGDLQHVVLVLEDQTERLPHPRVVVHHEDDGAGAAGDLGGITREGLDHGIARMSRGVHDGVTGGR